MTWVPPQYDVDDPAKLRMTRIFEKSSEGVQNFPRMAKWSPDGSTVLCQCENRSFELSSVIPPGIATAGVEDHLLSWRTFRQPSPILDFAWYPAATSSDAASFCFVASVRECPVKLLDASDGRLRASYKIVDHRERQIAPHSIAFNTLGNKIYCGFEDAIEVFDVHCPGEGVRLHTTPSKKSKDGLKGIISALAFSPSHDIYAAGSLAPSQANIALFSEADEQPVMFVSAGIKAAVTQLHFNPIQPHILYASFRRHEAIYSWDVRADVHTPLQIFRRGHEGSHESLEVTNDQRPARQKTLLTNQKMRFDVDFGGKWLGVGDQNGSISLFDLKTEDATLKDNEFSHSVDIEPSLTYKAHDDAIGSVGFHPLHPLLLSVSGSRHFTDGSDTSGSSDCNSDEEEAETRRERPPKRATKGLTKRQPKPLDASIKIWSFQGSRNDHMT